ncbi:MAG: hypothetical protein ACXU9H_06660, partial [Candidatus Binataceae bacterium]
EDRVVRGVAAARDRAHGGHVEDPVLVDVALVEVHPDDLADDEMAIGVVAVDVAEVQGVGINPRGAICG